MHFCYHLLLVFLLSLSLYFKLFVELQVHQKKGFIVEIHSTSINIFDGTQQTKQFKQDKFVEIEREPHFVTLFKLRSKIPIHRIQHTHSRTL